MTWYTQKRGAWREDSGPDEDGTSIQVKADDESMTPVVRVLRAGREYLHLSGVEPKAHTDTTHTIARLEPDGSAKILFAVHAQENDLIFEDRRSAPIANDVDQALEQVQSSLKEILIPVYIDDVISDLSDTLSGLILLHTVQYDDERKTWSYVRMATFEDGDVGLEVERGRL